MYVCLVNESKHKRIEEKYELMVFTCGRSNFISVINEILKKVFSYPLDAKKRKNARIIYSGC